MLLPQDNRARALVYFAGPLANLILFAFGAVLLVQTDQATLFQLINPFDPHSFVVAKWEVSLMTIIAWVNFQLFAVNMIPCFPFDGAQILRVLVDVLNPTISKLHSEASIKVFGQAVAIAFLGAAWFLQDFNFGPIHSVSWILLSCSVILAFCAHYSFLIETSHVEDPWDELNELDQIGLFDEASFFDYDSESVAGYSQWLAEKQEFRRQQELELEMEELEKSDAILEKLHQSGIDSLSAEEKSLLTRVSQRLRQQRQQQI